MLEDNNRLYFTLITWFIYSFTFIFFNFILFLFYKFNYYYKYHINYNKLPSNELILICLKHNFISHFIINPIIIYYSYPILILNNLYMNSNLPSIYIIIRDIIFNIIINDTLFYWIHRILHYKLIYKYIHKKHHQFKYNIGIASEFSHPIEHIFANILPTISGSILIGSHVYVFWLWLFIRVLETIDAHSGYAFPFSPFRIFSWQSGAERHDFHHSHNAGCYGSFTIFWDWITGTDAAFLQYKEKQRKEQTVKEYQKSLRKMD